MGINSSKNLMRKYLGDLVDSDEFKHLFITDKRDTHLHKTIKMIPKYPALNDYLEEYLKNCDPEEVNNINYYRETPLYLATIDDCCKRTVENLIKANSNIDLDVYDSIPALHSSVLCCSIEILKVLIEAKANVNLDDSHGCTALHYAVEKKSLIMIEMLINANINVNAQDLENKTALHYALESYYPQKIAIDVIKMLIDAGANVNLQDFNDRTALHYACSKKIAKILIDAQVKSDTNINSRHRVNLNLCDDNGNTSLQSALDIGAKGIAKLLIDAGIDVYNIKNKEGQTAYDMMDEEMRAYLQNVTRTVF